MLDELKAAYEDMYGKKVPLKYSKNAEWIQSKLDEEEEPKVEVEKVAKPKAPLSDPWMYVVTAPEKAANKHKMQYIVVKKGERYQNIRSYNQDRVFRKLRDAEDYIADNS